MNHFDVIIIGGGTSGMMAAISAAENGAKVAIIDKNRMLGKKLRLTGGGRCNVTNNRPPEEIINFIPGNGKFLYSAFSQFTNYDIMEFFETNGVPLKEEDHGRLFPVENTSKAIVEGLAKKLKELNVEIITKTIVRSIKEENGQISSVVTDLNEEYFAPCVVLTTGGKTFQYTGSTGDGYKFAKKFGHTITPLFATESPIKSKNQFVVDKTLQGLSLRDIKLSVLNNKNKVIVAHEMDLLFTHFGVSGPAALRCSMFVNQELDKGISEVPLSLDALPEMEEADLLKEINQRIIDQGSKSVKNGLKNLLPERYLEFMLSEAEIDSSNSLKQLTEGEKEAFISNVKDFKFTGYDTYPLDKSFVTGGGVELKEISPKTMESKLVNGLFFAGELLDVNGYTGGYNITAAFVTGHVAGKHAAEIASYFNY
ncbi:BaiN/RdsA family NAD(P)/FAD-dependent oxidoreductase [Vagococcus hydrophili]|uniref:NAD(P)/FAD-dependent oxidoreductase n=1 Tax=Vagococcus hydrophili TaxID=2714947 RepID=A0A6G8AVY2_9ENTE|nr:NAD(P)/FAD-dependent oxidoreductase [Vagococcus hydrophili]QIL49129.1 NAD(P)/FAD-dependent oxidoreductase [Vagococcus hydrophili]